MTNDVNMPGLVVDIEARIDKLEKGIAKANSIHRRGATEMENRARQSAKKIEDSYAKSFDRIGTFGKTFASKLTTGIIASGVAMLSLSAVIGKTKSALADFGDIADRSAQSGLDSEFFQELTYQASLAGVGMDELSSSLNTFSKNAGLAVVGKGKMVAALKALNPELLENIRNAKSQEERVRLAADAIEEAKTASEKAALATAMFGDAGTKLVSALKGGSAAMRDIASSARELGIIVDRELINRADQLGDEFDTATRIMDVQFKQAMINLAPILVSTASLASDIASAINLVVDSMRSVENQSNSMLDAKARNTDMQRLENENRILELSGQERDGTITMMDRAELADLRAKNDELTKQSAVITEIQAKRREERQAGKPAQNPEAATTLEPLSVSSAPRAGRNKAAEDAIHQAEAVKELISELEFERSLVGKSAVEQAQMNALRRAGAAATEEQRAKINQLIADTERESDADERRKQALEELKASTASFVTTFRQGMQNGEGAAASFRNAFNNLIDSMLQKMEEMIASKLIDNLFGNLLGGGLLGGLLGGGAGTAGNGITGAASPDFSSSVAAPQKAASFGAAGFVGNLPGYSQQASKQSSSSFSQPIMISAPISVQGSSGTPEQNADLAKQISREFESTVRGLVVRELATQLKPGNMLGRR